MTIYQRTRKYLLSDMNPWYLRGKAAEGYGSPHTGKEQHLADGDHPTSPDQHDATGNPFLPAHAQTTHAGTGFMHESFNKDNPADFSRKWFAWANTLFGELVIDVYHEHPEILKNV